MFDLLKVRAQNSKFKSLSYREEIKRIYKDDGVKGFTRGYSGMLLRDAPGFAIYFCMFDFLKRSFGATNLID